MTNILRIKERLAAFDFQGLFIEDLGWDRHSAGLRIAVEGTDFLLNAVAQKRGMVAYVFAVPAGQALPDYGIRRKIERQVLKAAHEHFIIYTDSGKSIQIWQWVKREPGKPAACREHAIEQGHSGEALAQRLAQIAFTLDEEEGLTLFEVTGRTQAAFDVERITKRFYDIFKTEHDFFLKFLKGIPDESLQRWYASVMLNRFMFIYFIQKKGFLNGDIDYLRNNLARCQEKGRDLFYREFLCPLFFEGFAKRPQNRSAETNRLLGKVPYLNGGLFLRYQIEELHGEKIRISDAAFERLFEFFDGYKWHLDERPLRDDKEINPDVLGYIFEKYINQKQMGAYYTKEDITGYISRNTIIPFLFETARKECKVAFEPGQYAWRLLQADPDRYIYGAVRSGVVGDGGEVVPESSLPDFVQEGMTDPNKRMFDKKYNLGQAHVSGPGEKEMALPTETWREYISRRQRCLELRNKLMAGEVHAINDLITLNLDIEQFAQDVIENCEGPDLLRAFWRAIQKITVLDPTCGSGAFLFAALNILETLYEACLDRMQVFVDELDRSKEKHRPEKFKDFRLVLEQAAKHPNRKYFIYKSIVINNLYGVDIMEEAVEICKLRLFLKLVAQVEDADKIEPLPDIDFNIRAGNTLVGYATYEQVQAAIGSKFDLDGTLPKIQEKAEDVERLFGLFRQQQTELGGTVTVADKQKLRARLQALEEELNGHLSLEYGIEVDEKKKYGKWLATHKPFHWFLDFYGILKNGGFDVIIGNPPYVEMKNVPEYSVASFETSACGDLYALVMERSACLLASSGYLGMIVPVSIASADGFESLRQCLCVDNRAIWCGSFAERPSKLFVGVEKRLSIWLMANGALQKAQFVSGYRRWFAEERDILFPTTLQTNRDILSDLVGSAIPKIGLPCEASILQKMSKQAQLGLTFQAQPRAAVYYTRKVRYFVQFFDFIPEILDSKHKCVAPSELKTINFFAERDQHIALAILNSNLFFWFYCVFSDVRNVNRREIEAFPCATNRLTPAVGDDLAKIAGRLMVDFKENAKKLTNDYGKHGQLTIQTFQPRISKPIIDEIDKVLAQHYGFTDEELDFIINYDIKYRMGRGEEEE